MKGINFIRQMYERTVAGIKTQTRRTGGLEYINEAADTWLHLGCGPVDESGKLTVTGAQPGEKLLSIVHTTNRNVLRGYVDSNSNELTFHGFKRSDRRKQVAVFRHKERGYTYHFVFPCYQPGETLYLKEPYQTDPETNQLIYRFDRPVREGDNREVKWKNKLFMPASAARAWIRITGVRCEPVRQISEADAKAEGADCGILRLEKGQVAQLIRTDPPEGSYRNGFEFILHSVTGGAQAWQDDKWVFVYEFELAEKP
ncbi:hypothetical protein [Arsenicibacter rosenii]|uniref:Uncharacterized protein n=1 Tax=Arsenicibacter rosenii TaxID=1750698 RepID=A0A1S2VM05_9BACT|nr:hypothetical protein [Arsenicibacter rosenii]OIN59792.1 hypothetical protein BLX24_08010 [Arsenicibacter rosenii]